MLDFFSDAGTYKFAVEQPCADCPFRQDILPFLDPRRAAVIAASMVRMGEPFPCHKTVNYGSEDPDTGERDRAGEKHCGGAMRMLLHEGKPNNAMQLAERLLGFDSSKLKKGKTAVFQAARDFVLHHMGGFTPLEQGKFVKTPLDDGYGRVIYEREAEYGHPPISIRLHPSAAGWGERINKSRVAGFVPVEENEGVPKGELWIEFDGKRRPNGR